MGIYKYPACPVLLVDDEPSWLRSMVLMLERLGGVDHVETCEDSREVLARLSQKEYSLILLDNVMPHFSGMELLPRIMDAHPELPVIILTGLSQVEDAVQCIKLGAFDYFVKTMEDQRLITGVKRALQIQEVSRENRKLRDSLGGRKLEQPEAFAGLLTSSARMISLFNYVEAIATSRQPVLISGESGTGKEVVAKVLHRISCPNGPLVEVDLNGVDDQDFSRQLFGQPVGSGDLPSGSGLVEKARGGMLLFDEVGKLPLACQGVLLRLCQSGEYVPPGSERSRRLRARLVFTSSQDLGELMSRGAFRKDLYYLLRTHHVVLPPLRERDDDVSLLANHFLAEAARELGKTRPTPPAELYTLLSAYHFPGNVSELRAMVYDAVTRHQGRKLSMESFREAMGLATDNHAAVSPGDEAEVSGLVSFGPRLPTIKQGVRLLVDEAMARADGNQGIAAGMLGISRPALNKRLKKLSPEDE